jgi:NADH dehydrogenase FAD-containing subunit
MRKFDPSLIDAKSQVKVQKTLQLDSDKYPHMFAAGDVVNVQDTIKMAYVATAQSKTVAAVTRHFILLYDKWSRLERISLTRCDASFRIWWR